MRTGRQFSYVIGPDTRIRKVSENIREVLGITGRELAGKRICQMPGEAARAVCRHVEKVMSGSPQTLEVDVSCRGAARLRLSSRPIRRKGKVVSVAGDARKIIPAEEKSVLPDESFYQELMDTLPDEIAVIDAKTRRILYANRQTLRARGIGGRDIKGMVCRDVFHKGRDLAEKCPLEETLRSGSVSRVVVRMAKDGRKKYYSFATVALRDSNGRTERVLHIARDITERKEAEALLRENRERYRRLVVNAPLGIMSVSKAGNIIDANRRALSLLELKSPKGINALEYEPLKASGIAQEMAACLGEKRQITAETPFPGGKESILRYHITPVLDDNGEVGMAEIILEDITRRVMAQEKLRQINNNILALWKTSTSLQRSESVDHLLDTAVRAFTDMGFDRVRIYMMRDGKLYGAKSNHLNNSVFRDVVLELSREFPKAKTAIINREPVITKKTSSRYTGILGKEDVAESASLPLLGKDRVIGLISLDNKLSQKKIQEDDLKLLMTFANQIALAVENAILHRENLTRLRTLSALYDISSALSGSLDMDRILNMIAIRIAKLLRIEACCILLPDTTGRALVPRTLYDVRSAYKREDLVGMAQKLARLTVREKDPVHIRDVTKEPRLGASSGIGSLLCVPLSVENNPVGVISVFTAEPRDFSPEELSLLKSISNQAAMAIDNTALYETVQADKNNLTALLELSQAINSTLDEEKLQELILEKTLEFTGARHGFLLVVKDGSLRVKLSRGFAAATGKIETKIGEGIAGHVAKTGQMVIVNDVAADSRYIRLDSLVRSAAALPLEIQGEVFGVLNLESDKPANFRRLRKSLSILTNQIAIAITNARFYDKVQNFNRRLRSEINSATRELRRKNIELRKMDQLKSDFVSNVSHELRTPLTSISGYTKLLILGKLGPVTKGQEKSLSVIDEETTRLTRLINNVLDLSKLEAGKIKFRLEKVNLRDVARSTIETMKAEASAKSIAIEFSPPKRGPVVKASRDLIKQVFINLLSNALKFTPEGGSVAVKLGKQDSWAVASVSDTGPGIPRSQLPRIFDKFYQIDSGMTRKHSGTGLGLVIVKHIIDAHGGKIRVQSAEGRGSRFTFSLKSHSSSRRRASS